MKKQEDILIPNKPSLRDIIDWFGLEKITLTGAKNLEWCLEISATDSDMRASMKIITKISKLPTENGTLFDPCICCCIIGNNGLSIWP